MFLIFRLTHKLIFLHFLTIFLSLHFPFFCSNFYSIFSLTFHSLFLTVFLSPLLTILLSLLFHFAYFLRSLILSPCYFLLKFLTPFSLYSLFPLSSTTPLSTFSLYNHLLSRPLSFIDTFSLHFLLHFLSPLTISVSIFSPFSHSSSSLHMFTPFCTSPSLAPFKLIYAKTRSKVYLSNILYVFIHLTKKNKTIEKLISKSYFTFSFRNKMILK